MADTLRTSKRCVSAGTGLTLNSGGPVACAEPPTAARILTAASDDPVNRRRATGAVLQSSDLPFLCNTSRNHATLVCGQTRAGRVAVVCPRSAPKACLWISLPVFQTNCFDRD